MQVFHNQRRAATVEITLRSKHAHNSYKAVPGGWRPDGWCAYLADLNALHFEGGFSDGFLEYRAQFLKRRGLGSALEILYRTTESHGLVQ